MNVDIDSLLPEIEAKPDLPEPNVTTDAPADKHDVRDDDGKYAPKDGKKEETKAKAPDPKPEVKPEPKAEPKTIPLAAHIEERKALKAELDALRKQMEALQNPPKPPAPEPAYEADPKGYVDHTVSTRVQAALEQLEGTKKEVEQVRQAAQQSQQQTEQMKFMRQLETAEAVFMQENPDYYEALAHVRNYRRQQLQLLAPQAQPQEITDYIAREEIQAAAQLAQSGRNPIEVVYSMAKAIGYQQSQAKEELKLPQVPGQKQLPPDQTLGSTGAAANEPSENESADPFSDAFAEMFGKRKAS
jgi:hypothetical protein